MQVCIENILQQRKTLLYTQTAKYIINRYIYYNKYWNRNQMSINSRLQFLNLRDRKNMNGDTPLVLPQSNNYTQQQGLKLVLPQPAYEPTNPTTNARTSLRLLKGKLDRGASNDKEKPSNFEDNPNLAFKNTFSNIEPNSTFKNKMEDTKGNTGNTFYGNKNNGQEILNQTRPNLMKPPLPPQQPALKLVLPQESDTFKEKQKKIVMQPVQQINPSQSKEGFAKKILIERSIEKQNKEQKKINIKQAEKIQQPIHQNKIQDKRQVVNMEIPLSQLKQIQKEQQKDQQQEKQEIIENQNQLVQCPQGCGRKFNRKALETHAKACKIVFMSKRKEFNSQAKRVTSKQQANLVKQAKIKEKKEISTKLQKTGQAWKTQSQGFRAVVKALKQEQIKPEEDVKPTTCEFCEKIFNTEAIYNKHLLVCQVKKQKQKEKDKKAKKNTKK